MKTDALEGTALSDTPVPRQLNQEERALWEKANEARREIANEVPASEPQWYTAFEAWRDHGYTKPVAEFIDAASPEFILSLLTALSSEREAGERNRERIAEPAVCTTCKGTFGLTPRCPGCAND